MLALAQRFLWVQLYRRVPTPRQDKGAFSESETHLDLIFRHLRHFQWDGSERRRHASEES
jgi:hypothetical protein